VATHAHDDHFAGIADVFQQCESAKFVCSRAITKEEFTSLTLDDRQVMSELRLRAYAEYSKVFRTIRARASAGPSFKPVKYAYEWRELLSPSDEAFNRSLEALASEMPTPGSKRKGDLGGP
jgi:hypothetical protein